ncbi:MAG: type II toxin-antitoxin system HipA family toxin [Pseudomonadota bacterium]|nr:type II toxin-antitoxin system HipA family toxin [Pseudomonadota bacterium]
MMSSNKTQLYVYMNDILVGTLVRKSSRDLEFHYHPSWLERENARPISLSMPIREKAYSGDVVNYFFDNLLPDNDKILDRIQREFGANSKKSFDLLYHIGADCVGALQFLPENVPSTSPRLQADLVDDASIAKLLKNYRTEPLGMAAENDFRISLAGAQEKTALLWYKKKWWRPKCGTPTTHIIKQPIGIIKEYNIDLSDSVENEWLCLKILSHFDLPVSHADITMFDDVKALVVERFDRKWNVAKTKLIRLPQEDMCQVLGFSPGLKYERYEGGPGILQIMKKLQGSDNAIMDRYNFMKTVFLFWLLAAPDGHAKNFSVFLKPKGRYQLTPLYDVISAYPLMKQRQIEERKLVLAMAVHGKNRHYRWNEIQLRHWHETAEKCHFPVADMQKIIDEVFANVIDVISRVRSSLPKGFPAHISDPIFSGLERMTKKYKS